MQQGALFLATKIEDLKNLADLKLSRKAEYEGLVKQATEVIDGIRK